MDYLRQLAREWYEYHGYFVRRALPVGTTPDGAWECALDIVALHLGRHHVIHIEPSFTVTPLTHHSIQFQQKFDAGKKYLHRLFNFPPRLHIEQIALIENFSDPPLKTIGGGRVLYLNDLVSHLLKRFAELGPRAESVPTQWPLLRTLQLASICGHSPGGHRIRDSSEETAISQYDPRLADDSS